MSEPTDLPPEGAATSASSMSFWRQLPREGRLLLTVVVFEFLGTGLVIPFNVVYLHEIRGFTLSDVGLLLGLAPLVGLFVVGPGGALIDRYGARPVVVTTTALLVVADVALAFADTLTLAALAVSLQGVAFGVVWPAAQSLIAAAIPSELRQRYFGVNFTLLNLGIGIGGIAGGFFVDVHHPSTFQAIYLTDAVSYLPGLYLLLVPLRHLAGRPVAEEGHALPPGETYLQVLRRPAVPMVMLLSFASSYVGYSQLNSGTQAFARDIGEVSTRTLGFAYAGNTLVIVLLQLVVLRRIEGRRRTRVMIVMSLIWAVSWLVLGASGWVPGTIGAAVLVVSCVSLFALGETLLQPTIPALTNDLAPDHLRGRYNALSAGAFGAASVVAPATAGFLIDHGAGSVYIGSLVVGCGLVALIALRIEPQLPPGVNGERPVGEPMSDVRPIS